MEDLRIEQGGGIFKKINSHSRSTISLQPPSIFILWTSYKPNPGPQRYATTFITTFISCSPPQQILLLAIFILPQQIPIFTPRVQNPSPSPSPRRTYLPPHHEAVSTSSTPTTFTLLRTQHSTSHPLANLKQHQLSSREPKTAPATLSRTQNSTSHPLVNPTQHQPPSREPNTAPSPPQTPNPPHQPCKTKTASISPNQNSTSHHLGLPCKTQPAPWTPLRKPATTLNFLAKPATTLNLLAKPATTLDLLAKPAPISSSSRNHHPLAPPRTTIPNHQPPSPTS